jgi:parallel beta-helix repeat protein
VVARNSCAENTLDGINAGDGNRIVGNNCVGNGNGGDGAGIHVTSQRNVIMDNTVLQNDRGIDVDAVNNLIVKNSASSNDIEYSIVGGNKVGATSADPTTAGPWANFDF